jgi:hypothetical protein
MTGKRWCSRVLSAIGALALVYMVLDLALPLVFPSAPSAPAIECTVANNSSEVLERVVVSVYHHTYSAEGLPPGASFTFTFNAGDDHYHVDAQLASGNRLVSDVGYVTTGVRQKDRIEIRADEIRITTKSG